MIFLVINEAVKIAEELKKGFDIYNASLEIVEAIFTHDYMIISNMLRELIIEGWDFGEIGKVIIDIPRLRKTPLR